ncbi:hypothetical protein L6164_026535 [Bauhinia variegata]|uniref:Uncharacterized protein n=1 Tax=Bauhinia variegata TaxID=167791 RepID=A0ACB9LQ84_BAUVA|nr:hypothetical protein L6164_026535 [Bauhinia variegata]
MESNGKTSPESEIPDWEQDISSHMKLKNRVLGNPTEKFEYFNSLSLEFVVPDPNGEPAFVEFLGEVSGFVKRRLLSGEDDFIKDPHYELFSENSRLDEETLVLEILQDNVLVRYDDAEDIHNKSNSGKNRDFGEKHVSLETNMNLDAAEKHLGRKHVSLQTNVGSDAEKLVSESGVQDRRRCRPKKVLEARVAGNATKKVQVDLRNQNVSSGADIKEEIHRGFQPKRKRPEARPILNVNKRCFSHIINKKERREFREKLIAILQKPYCDEEYETLYQRVSLRKPMQRSRELRNGKTIVYEDDVAGKSYLDHYTDLVMIIDSIQDDRARVLNLLRGFFYWMEAITHEGAFIPWKDQTCLEVMPAVTK